MRKPTNKRTRQGLLALAACVALAPAVMTPLATAAPTNANANSVEAICSGQSAIHGDTMTVNVRSDQLPFAPDAVDAAVGFTIQPDPACGSGLAVRTVA